MAKHGYVERVGNAYLVTVVHTRIGVTYKGDVDLTGRVRLGPQ
jgi:hypothetical protein